MKYLFPLFVFTAAVAGAQPSVSARDSMNRLTEADYNIMLEQLSIPRSTMRRGPSGNPQAPDAANSSESRVNNYKLSDPLVLKNGLRVNDIATWKKLRAPEIVNDFEWAMYGRVPDHVPAVQWTIVTSRDTTVGNYRIKEKILRGHVDNSSFPAINVDIELLLATPASASGPVPVVIEFGFIRSPWDTTPVKPISLVSAGEPTWKEQLIAKGWGYAIVVPSTIQPDFGGGLTTGIIGLVNKGKHRTPEQWGSLRAWAWGASRVVDYLETDQDADSKRLAIEGLSRYGKAALVTMAFEPRISLGFIGSSGAGGAKILRRHFGEQIENLASSAEYHWFAGNFLRYASMLTENDLPVDAHALVALCAPRPVFISVGSPHVEGQWIDAKGNFLGGVHASPVYRLFGKKGLVTETFPPLGTPLVDGEIAFRQHAGGHSTGPNWSTWIAWASRYWEKTP